jgi:integrase
MSQRESDGKWCASVDLGFVNRKRRRKVMDGTTRREDADKLKTTQYAQASGANLAAKRITVRQFLERWLSAIVSRRNKSRTIDGDTLCLARVVELEVNVIYARKPSE